MDGIMKKGNHDKSKYELIPDRLKQRPFLLFLPFLLLYIVFIIVFSKDTLIGDEGRYLRYAENLTKGFFSPPLPGIDLGNGPGYPLIIAPFIKTGVSLLFIKLLNAIFYYFSVVFIYKSIKTFASFRVSFVLSIIWALYPNSFEKMSYVLPESLSISLIPLLLFFLLKSFESLSKWNLKYIILSGCVIGFSILIKPIFGYVLLTMIVGSLILLMTNLISINFRRTVAILVIALLTNIPYLIYTYQLTDKMFYWSSFGGNNLYWMSTPFEDEYGDWFSYPHESLRTERISGSHALIDQRHGEDFKLFFNDKEFLEANPGSEGNFTNMYKGVKQDEIYKQLAIRNIKAHPYKFFQNIVSNMGRMLFNYPGSYVLQKPTTLRRLPVNGTLIVLCVFCLFPTILNWRKVLYPIRFALFFFLIYFGGSLLGSAEPRMFTPIVPALFLWFAYILPKSVSLRLTWKQV